MEGKLKKKHERGYKGEEGGVKGGGNATERNTESVGVLSGREQRAEGKEEEEKKAEQKWEWGSGTTKKKRKKVNSFCKPIHEAFFLGFSLRIYPVSSATHPPRAFWRMLALFCSTNYIRNLLPT